MAAAAEPLSPAEVAFLGPADLARPLPDVPVLVFLGRLDDPALAAFVALPPDSSDLADEARPAASPRGTFRARRAVTRGFVARLARCPPEAVVIGYDAEGAPLIRAPAQAGHVSVAGRGDFLAVALAREPVGVDLEPRGSPQPPVLDVLNPRERARLAPLDAVAAHEAFLAIWTAKEAGLKAGGLGLKTDPATIETQLDGQGGFVLADAAGPFARGRHLHRDDWIAAVAILARV